MSETKFIGFTAFEYLLDQMNKDFGVADARKNVLIPAAKNAMKIVLEAAKNNLYPGHGLDTGQLKRTLTVSARPVKGKDLRSKYVKQGDIVIATVSAKLQKHYIDAPNSKGGIRNIGDVSDARAIAVEFGTKNHNKNVNVKGLSKRSALAVQREFGTVRMEARPYLRPALESKQSEVTEKLNQEIKIILDKYKSNQAG
jgi:HK97 gp10 family phage protein